MRDRLKLAFLNALDLEFRKFNPELRRTSGDLYKWPSPLGRLAIAVTSVGKSYGLELYAPFASIRLEEIEGFVARFEERPQWLTESDWAEGIADRSTLEIRITRNPGWWLWEGSWSVYSDEGAARVAHSYARRVYPRASRFWREFDSSEKILTKLMKYRTLGHGVRAIAIAALLQGDERGRAVTNELCAQAKPNISAEIRAWADRAFAFHEERRTNNEEQ